MGDYNSDIERNLWNGVVMVLVQRGEYETAIESANKILAAYRANFAQENKGDEAN